jgi:HlyD family secretion protein
MLFKKISFYLAIAGIAGVTYLVMQLRKTPPAPPPLAPPTRSPYPSSVAATGIIESTRENVKVAAPKGGLIQKLSVHVGSQVKAGDVVLLLDNREAKAKVATMEAQLEVLRAALKNEQVLTADAADQFAKVEQLQKQNVSSEDERKRKEYTLQSMQARVARIEADIKSAQAQVAQAKVELDVLSVRAPRDGTILQVNVREGEYAGTSPTEPLIVLGEVDKFQVRAEVDEQNAPLVFPNQPAVAFLKGSTQKAMPLRFVRIEPFVIPKRSLTGDSAERVDTRVLQIIFELDRSDTPMYVGQQVDVFIQRPADKSVAAGTEAKGAAQASVSP